MISTQRDQRTPVIQVVVPKDKRSKERILGSTMVTEENSAGIEMLVPWVEPIFNIRPNR